MMSPHHDTPTPRMQMNEEMENALRTNTTSLPDMNSTMNYENMTEAKAEVNDESRGNGTDRKRTFPVSTIVRKRPTYIVYNACIKLCTDYLPTICSRSAPPSFPPPPPPPPPFNCTWIHSKLHLQTKINKMKDFFCNRCFIDQVTETWKWQVLKEA